MKKMAGHPSSTIHYTSLPLEETSSTSGLSSSSHEFLAPTASPGSAKRRRQWTVAAFAACILALLVATADLLQSDAVAWASQQAQVVASGLQQLPNMAWQQHSCRTQDPYSQPGFLWRSSNRTMLRWIPLADTFDGENATATKGTFPVDRLPAQAVEAAPTPFLTLLQQRATRTDDARLDFLKNKTIAIAGCSLDRIALESMCNVLGSGFHNGWHDLSTCYFEDLDLMLQIWFHFGVTSTGEKAFEHRMANYTALMVDQNRKPDLIILASGTWDTRALDRAFHPSENMSANKKVNAEHSTPVMPWEAYAYYRTRLREMINHLRQAWPSATLMFRPETYVHGNINAEVYNTRESAIAVMHAKRVPIFPWGEKLVGELDMVDRFHYRENSGANWLYGDMLLHYLRLHTEGSGNCR